MAINYEINRGAAGTIVFNVTQTTANARQTSFTGDMLAAQFAQVWNAAIATGAAGTTPFRIRSNRVGRSGRTNTGVMTPVAGAGQVPGAATATGNVVSIANVNSIVDNGGFSGTTRQLLEEVTVVNTANANDVRATLVPTPIRQLLKHRGGKVAGSGIGAGRRR